MINIYCCDDNEMERKELKSVIEEGIRTEGMEFCLVTTTASPYELLEIAANDTESCVFFLDVELGVDMNGLSLAQKLRERFPRCYIIFTTSHSEMSYMTFTYKVEAMDFIIKGDLREMKNRVTQCLARIEELERRQKTRKSEDFFSIKIGSKIKNIMIKDILYFEVADTPHKLVLHCERMSLEFSGKMKDIENKMPSSFCRCHRGVIVNKAFVDKVDYEKGEVLLKNGDVCPVSIRLGKGLKGFE